MLSVLLTVTLFQPIPTPPQAPPVPQAPEAIAAPAAPPTYAECRARAIAEGKPLVVWAGTGDVVCPACMHTLAEAVHHVTPTFPGVTGTAIVVAVPEGGELLRVADITQWTTGSPDFGHVPSVRRALRNWRERRAVIRGGWSVDAAPAPVTTPFVPATRFFVPLFSPRIASFLRVGC